MSNRDSQYTFLRKQPKDRAELSGYKTLVLICYTAFVSMTKFIDFAVGSRGNSSRTGGILLIGAIAAAGIVFVLHNYKEIRLKFSIYHMLLFLFPIFCLITSSLAYSPSRSLSVSINLIEVACTYYLFSIIWEDYKDDLDSLLKVWMLSNYIMCAYVISSVGISGILDCLRNNARIGEGTINANTIGMGCAYAILINIYFLSKRKGIIFVPGMVIAGVLLIVSQSRKAMVILVLGGLILITLLSGEKRRIWKSFFKLTLTLGIVLIMAFLLSKTPYFEGPINRLMSMLHGITGDGVADDSFIIRKQMKQIGIEIFQGHPIIGIGIDNSGLIAGPSFKVNYYYLHDNYIELLADTGIIGFGLYYFIYAIILYRFVRYFDLDNKGLCVALMLLIMVLVTDYGQISYDSKGDYFYTMTLWFVSENVCKNYMPISSAKKVSKYIRQYSESRG